MSIAEQDSPTTSADANANALDDRYGRSKSATRKTKTIFIVTVGAFAVVFGAWLIWAGLLAPAAVLQTRDTGYSNLTENSIDVHFQLTIDPHTATRCAVEAMNESFSVVGWKIIDVPASETRTRSLSETVRTTETPVTGLIYRCWLA